jgi:hypothetical protein
VRIDRSGLADKPDDAHLARRSRSTRDVPDAVGKDQGNASGSDSPPDLSPASPEPASRIDQAADYRAAVDAAYRQYAIDHGYAGAGKPGGETIIPAMRHSVAEAPERHPRTMGTAADDVPTGARGPASGREFDPEAAGGPIQQLEAGKARITSEGIQEAAAHLRRFAGGGALEAPEQAMLDRLTSIANGDMEPTPYDLNFYTHELDEAARYAQLGLGPESGVDLGSPTMYEVWNNVHTAALEDYGISGADLFHPGRAP